MLASSKAQSSSPRFSPLAGGTLNSSLFLILRGD